MLRQNPSRSSGLYLLAFAIALCAWPSLRAANAAAVRHVLVFTKTQRFHHDSIPAGVAAITELGRENNFEVDATAESTAFTDESLRHYDAVAFLSTTGNVLNAEEKAALVRYIQAGGGFVGIHSATATEYGWPWYNHLIGAYLSSHPLNPGVRPATVVVVDHHHPSTSSLPDRWERADEWYNFRSIYPDLHVLAELDENTYEGGTNGGVHPIAWYHTFDGGRAFYTALGHEAAAFSEPLFRQHLLGGIVYAIGDGRRDYTKATAVVEPEEARFVKTVLVDKLHQPMELAVATDGRIFFTELATGRLMEYNPKTGAVTVIHQFKISTVGGTGLIGIALDPRFETNHFIYLYYAPPKEDEPILFNLSRFTFDGVSELIAGSEKVLLQVPVQKKSGSHHGGSLAWDREGNLFLSTGDSSSPAPSEGYAPLDERPGAEHYSLDSQRSAANTNDFKGKILRIHPELNGTYTIPKNNLFPVGTEKTHPEIFAMGVRNPYRIAVNPKSSVLYWGEPGPDAGEDSARGPRGYDEFNQAKKAGNYGWPYFIGNNLPYAKWDFATKTAGPLFNPIAPENHSPNNTGLVKLPPAQPAMIWYPYSASRDFPELGQGGRCAMAGEFYEFDEGNPSSQKFPRYYDGSLFVFDWMRNWVIALRFDKNENYIGNVGFMTSNGDFRRPIDLAFGRDGVMYMLEYGSVYGFDNEDARLVKIEYNSGARAPVAKAGIVNEVAERVRKVFNKNIHLTSEEDRVIPTSREIVGAAPLTLSFTSAGSHSSDDDQPALEYTWSFDGRKTDANTADATHTFASPGIYPITLTVKSNDGLSSSDQVTVRVGNEPPAISVTTDDNRSFYWDDRPFHYKVLVSDREDGPGLTSKVSLTSSKGHEALIQSAGLSDAAAEAAQFMSQPLIAASDCRACHTVETKSVGPAFRQVAEKYKGDPSAQARLAKKVITGGVGNWGEVAMIAHPQISPDDVDAMVKSILALADVKGQAATLPAEGQIAFQPSTEKDPIGSYTFSAEYTDKGANGVAPLVAHSTMFFRPAKMPAAFADGHVGFERFRDSLGIGGNKSYLLFKQIDLTGLKSFTFEYASLDSEGEIQARLESFAGPVIAEVHFAATGGWDKTALIKAPVTMPTAGFHNLYFVVRKHHQPDEKVLSFTSISFGAE